MLRDMVRQKKITMEEGTLMRTLLFMPGGLELHIGVSSQAKSNVQSLRDPMCIDQGQGYLDVSCLHMMFALLLVNIHTALKWTNCFALHICFAAYIIVPLCADVHSSTNVTRLSRAAGQVVANGSKA